MVKKFKNPLSVIFGRALQKLRKKESVRVEEISQRLELAPSAYRMIESGYANLNATRVLNLISISCFVGIHYERVARVLTAIQVLESAKNNKSETANVLIELFLVDTELQIVFGSTVDVLEILLEDEKTANKFYTDEALVQRMVTYLTNSFENAILELRDFLATEPKATELITRLFNVLSLVENKDP